MAQSNQAASIQYDGSRQFVWGLILAVVMAAVVGTALVFEHGFGFIPCKLCLEQRTPYYFGIPVALLAAFAAWQTWPGIVSRVFLAVVGLLMTWGLVLAVYHSGVEWQFWPGPTDCGVVTDSSVTDANNLLGALDNVRAPACDQVAGRFLGLSFAGWNVIASLGLALAAFRAAIISAE